MAKKKQKNVIVEKEGRKIILDVGDLSWVKAGKNRIAAVRLIGDGYKAPRDLAEATGITTNTASKVFRACAERGIAECINPDDVRGRLYGLTKKGLNLWENL